MRNSTFNQSGFFRLTFLIVFLLLNAYSASAQFYTKHYIAPAPWQYFNDANEIVIATNSTSSVNITVSKSNGTLVTNLTAIKGTPAVYRFVGTPSTTKAYVFDTVLNGAGLIVEGSAPVSINLRNVASDALSGTNVDKDIKGNAALTSFGDAGLGVRFRVGYYRDGSLGNFNSYGDQRPIYSVMATVDNTTIKIDNTVTTTLNAGQSYLFKAPIGTLVESSSPVVMNTSAAIDTPGGCGDSAYNQIPPEAVLGTEYFLERGTGNSTAEQTTVVATKDDTNITIEGYSVTGALVTTKTIKLALAGQFHTFVNGSNNTNFTASHIVADKRVAVYSGTAQGCEVDISTIAPVSECGGSEFIETSKFKGYTSNNLDYFGYILLRSKTEDVKINGVKTTDISGIGARYEIGSTGWYIINFNSEKIGRPEYLSIESKSKMTVSIVQQAGGFSMAGFFSTFAALPGDPGLTYIEGGGCTNNAAELTTPAGFAPYQWYYNGTAIAGANSPTYTATKTGNYSVSSTLVCGAQTPSKTVAVTLCTDLGITKTVDNTTPCIGSNVEFTVKVSNLGGNNVSGVSVTDLLPSGYTYVSSTPSVGAYNSGTGLWTIGDVEAQTSMTLKIVATVNASGNYMNTASLPNAIDTNTANNSASAAVNPKTSNLIITNPAATCRPATVDLTASAITAGSTSNMTLSYWTNSGATTALASPSAVSTSGTYYIKAVSADGCQFIKPVVVTLTAQTATPTISPSTTCPTGSVVLTATSGGASYLWSTGATTQAITVTTEGSYTVQKTDTNSCISNSSAAYTVTFRPDAPTASNQTFCSSENKTVGDLVATGSNIKWYSANTGGTALASSQVLVNNTTYYATQTVNTCESSTRTPVLVTVNTKSSAPVAAASQSFCAADNKTVADLSATGGTTRKWYDVSSGGSPLSGTQVLANGDYYVSQTANSCGESDRTKVTVTINTIPSAPTASSQTFCSTDNRTVGNLSPSGSTYKWYDVSSNGTALASTTVLATKTYYVTQTNSCGESARTPVSVVVNNTTAPTASAQTFCAIDGRKVNNLAATGTALKWYSANTGGTAYTGNEVLTTGTYYVTQTLNSCESLRTAVSVTVNNTPAPTASAQTFCSGDTKKVSDLSPSGAAYKWYNASTGGTLFTGNETLANGNYYVSQTVSGCESSRTLVTVTVNPTPATPTISADGATTFCQGGSVTLKSTSGSTYLWSTGETTQSITVSASGSYTVKVTNATGCPSALSTPTTVTVNTIPTAPTASAQSFCSADAKKVGDLLPSGTAYKWYDVATAGTALQSTEVLSTKIYYVSETSNECEGPRTSVSVTVTTTPSAPTTTAQSFCSADNRTVANLVPSGAAYKWYAGSTGGTALASTDALTSKTYYVSETLNGCEGQRASSVVTVTTTPSAPTATAQSFCSVDAKKVSDLLPSGTAYKWYDVATAGTALQSTDVLSTKTYYVSETLNGCEGPRRSVSVTVTTNPVAPTLGSITQPTCSKFTGSFTISNYNSTYTYTITPSTGVTNNAGTITAPTGSYTISASANGCVSGDVNFVINSILCANTDPFGTKTSGSSAVNVGNVKTNDTLNGTAVTAANTEVTPKTDGVLNVDADGEVTLVANAPSGSYSITYEICEKNTSNCKTATATVDVVNGLVANADPLGTKTSGSSAVNVGNVKTNDTLNGTAVTAANTEVTPKTDGALSVDAAGEVTLAANAPSGSYSITYEICEKNTSNCKTATATVDVVNGLVANADPFGTKTSGTSAVNVGNVKTNDTLNGTAVTAANTEVTPKTDGALSVDAAGEVTLAANAPSGSYSITYEICEKGASNCKTATATVDVVNGLVANADPFGTKTSGSSAVNVGNVKANDTLNGTAVTAANTEVTPKTDGALSVDAAGEVTLAANAPSGSYSITYEICEKGASNCKTATATVDVVNGLVANADPFGTKTSESSAVNVGNVKANDTLNGTAVRAANTEVTPKTDGALSVDAAGEVTLAANAPSGSYSITYEICEKGASNCKTATATVDVVNGLVANADPLGTKTSGSLAVNVGNVKTNDTLNGTAVTALNTEVTPKTDGVLSVDADGEVTLAANAPSGSYSITYEICEKGASNCKTATATVIVENKIKALVDTITPINGNIGGTTIALTANDTLNGNSFVIGTNPGEVTINIVGTLPTGLTLNSNGTITVSPATPKGDYNVEYTICEAGAIPANCDSVTIVVPVTAANLVANLDSLPAVTASNTSQTLGTNVLDNDTKNGSPLNPSDVTLSTLTPDPTGYLVLNSDGTLTLGANAPAGNYELTYQICEKLNVGNCDSNTVKVTVSMPVIDAVVDSVTSVKGNIGGTTVSLIANDTLNGNPVVVGTAPGEVTFGLISTLPAGLTLNADYTITVAPNTPAGNYNVEYRICEITNPSNCDSVTIVVPVTAASLVANTDSVSGVTASNTTQTLGTNVFDNDTFNGSPLNPSDVILSTSTPDPKGYLVLNPDGTLTLAANAPAGNYDLTYTICEKLNLANNCSSNTVRVIVDMPVIDAVADPVTSINGNIGGTTISLISNDKLNGNPVVVGTAPGEVTFGLISTLPAGLTLNPDFTITVVPNTPAGNYNVEYRICDNINSGNCDSVITVVTVTGGNLVANQDVAPSVVGLNVPQTLINVFDNDTKNGKALVPSDVNLSVTTVDPKGYLTVDANGNAILAPNAPAGDYELTYTICEKLNPSNCNSNIVKVTVLAPTMIKANDDVAGPVDVKKGTDASTNIFNNDNLNGVKPTESSVILSTLVANPNLILNADGSVHVAANTPNGIYELTYQICEAANTSNCSQAVVKVTVLNSVDPSPPTSTGITLVDDNDITADGINGDIEFVNVLNNDLINGQPINPANVTIKALGNNPYFEFNADGTVNVKPNTPGKAYAITYQVCEKADPTNCSTAILNVFVEVPAIAIIKTAEFNDEDKSGFANAGETITYKFTVTNTGNVPLINVTVKDPLTGVVVSGQAISLAVGESNNSNFTAVYKITQEDINLGKVTNQATAQGSSIRKVIVEDKSDDVSNDGDNPTVLSLDGCSIKVFNAFSPNGDAKNARFFIRGIECYPNNTVEIYNRWGVLVYAIDQYDNNDRVFTGYSNGRSTIKQTEGLPVGTYFYILKYQDANKAPHEQSGYLYINK